MLCLTFLLRFVDPSLSIINLSKSCDLVSLLWRKTQKKKNPRWLWECFSSYLHGKCTWKHNSNRFRKLQYRATTLIFFSFLGKWSCDIYCDTYVIEDYFLDHASYCLSFKKHLISILGPTLNTATHTCHTYYALSVFFSDFFWFFPYFIAVFHEKSSGFHFWTDPEYRHTYMSHMSSTISIILWFSLIFSYFIDIFHQKSSQFCI